MEQGVSRDILEHFWAAMARNDFRAAGDFLHDDFILDWPQSGERIRGRDNFVAVNEHYPAAGRWQFAVHRLVADSGMVVTDVTVTDGVQMGRAITFSELRDGWIVRQVEYWPEPFEAAAWRRPWTEKIE